jgi:hypothetical protein
MSFANGTQDMTAFPASRPAAARAPIKLQHGKGASPPQPATPELEFIPVEEVARKLGGVCFRTIRRLSDQGELCQPVKVGGRSMYPKQEVIDFMYRKMRERRA